MAQLQRQFIWGGTGGVVVAASMPDVFLHGGTGDDALSAMSGVVAAQPPLRVDVCEAVRKAA